MASGWKRIVTRAVVVILVHQLVFQGMFLAKNVVLRRRLGMPIRGRNREATLSIAFIGLFIVVSLLLGASDAPLWTIRFLSEAATITAALALLVVSVCVGLASLVGLRDSWRVGVLEEQQTELIEGGIYRFTRNPYFVAYLVTFVAYTVLLQSAILLVLSLVGFALIHSMVLKEERHLAARHGDRYRRYRDRVPRYLIV